MKKCSWILVLVSAASTAVADVKLPAVFADHMVLQQETSAVFWGWAEKGEGVAVSGTWGEKAATTADDTGKWKVALKTPAAGGPYSVTVKGKNTIELQDVLIGEVWLCSGQSNMGMTVNGVINADKEIAAAKYPQMRLLGVNRVTANAPQTDCAVVSWAVCSPETVRNFTAAGYFFGRKLYQDLKIPIGLINTSWGGSCIETWTPWESQKDDDVVKGLRASWDARDEAFVPEKAKAKYAADLTAWKAWLKGGRKGKALRRPRVPI
ncbi:MAG: sialate O-acetylesterase, partial [Planctomycetota bacterium]|nr:sialate O-acetylesterase [Planctomycetota bacterium]